jgi:uncharacterized repeat protein (TIGR03803 family)
MRNPRTLDMNRKPKNFASFFIAVGLSLLLACGGCSTGSPTPGFSFSFKVLHSFTGTDGAVPLSGVVLDPQGNIYGTTYQGGPVGGGVVFKVDPTGSETVLFAFQTDAEGVAPWADLTMDEAGNLYGTAAGFGPGGCGVVFELDPAGTETILYAFTCGNDGENPHGGVIRDSAGNLYGTTEGGGSGGYGTVFKLDTAGNITVFHSFSGPDGSEPFGDLAQDAAGNLYGVTIFGGNYAGPCLPLGGCGVVYKVDTMGNFSLLHVFSGPDGSTPSAGVTLDSAGNLYGTTSRGGQGVDSGAGVIFKIDAAGNETTLYAFAGGPDGAYPLGPVVLDGAGNLYGTANSGGDVPWPFGDGVVFMLDVTGKETVLHTFSGGPNGALPIGTLARDSSGHLYGTAGDGASGLGVVFKL